MSFKRGPFTRIRNFDSLKHCRTYFRLRKSLNHDDIIVIAFAYPTILRAAAIAALVPFAARTLFTCAR